MQVKRHHIGCGERLLWQVGEKEFVDHPLASVTDVALFRGRWVAGHHDPAADALRPHHDIGTVVELAHQIAFRTAELLIGRQVQTAASPRADLTRCNLCRASQTGSLLGQP
jgi:hypothetical protein